MINLLLNDTTFMTIAVIVLVTLTGMIIGASIKEGSLKKGLELIIFEDEEEESD